MEKQTGEQGVSYVLKCWKIYAQGLGSGWAGILRFGAMYWTPLICYSIVYGQPDKDPKASVAKSKSFSEISLFLKIILPLKPCGKNFLLQHYEFNLLSRQSPCDCVYQQEK